MPSISAESLLAILLYMGYDYPYAGTPFLLKPDQDYYAIPSSSFQLTVSHVCRKWRQIALQTPSLWSMLHFREPGHIERAQEYISRCLPSPHLFDILVDTVAEKEHIKGVTLCREEIHQIFKVICPHVKRWRAFHLKVRDHECKAAARQHLSTCGPAPNLETLQLYHFEDYLTSQNLYLATYRPPVMVFSNDLPRLKNISLIGVNLPWEHSPYLAQLHNLELALHPENIRPPYEYWENMLRNSPDLQTLSLHYSGPRVANGDTKLVWPTNSERITIQSLANLSLTDLDPDYLVRLMGRLILPGLKRLSLDLPDQDFTPFIELISLNTKDGSQSSSPSSPSSLCFPHLPFPAFSKLENLVLTALEASADSLRNFMRGLNELRTLEVHFASVSDVLIDILMEEIEVEVRDEAPAVLRPLPECKPLCKANFSLCPSRAASVALPFDRRPVLPLLQTLKMSGLSGLNTGKLIGFRYTHSQKLHRYSKGRDGADMLGISRWLVKWSEKWKGKDAVLDELVEQGWAAGDGPRVYLETFFDEEGDEDGYEEEVENGGEEAMREGGEEEEGEAAEAQDENGLPDEDTEEDSDDTS